MDSLLIGNQDSYNSIVGHAKNDLINTIIDKMGLILNGGQLYELNKTLNQVLEEYEVFVAQNLDLDKNYEESNKKLLELFIESKKLQGLSEKTIHIYSDENTKFLNSLNKNIINIQAEDIRNYLSFKQELGNSPRTLNNVRRFLNSFLSWLCSENFMLKNPMDSVPKIKEPKRVKKPFTDTEIEKLRDYVIDRKPNGKIKGERLILWRARSLALMELLLSSGIRVSECSQLKRTSFDFTENSFRVIGKGNKERTCYFNDRAKHRLKEYFRLRPDDNSAAFVGITAPYRVYMTNGIESLLRQMGEEAGVENVHPHRFRRTFATNLMLRGLGVDKIKDLMGHESIETTMIYTSIKEEDLKYVHKKYTRG